MDAPPQLVKLSCDIQYSSRLNTRTSLKSTLRDFKKHFAASRGITVSKGTKPALSCFSVHCGKNELKDDSHSLESLGVQEQSILKISLAPHGSMNRTQRGFIVKDKMKKCEYSLRMHRNASNDDVKHRIQDEYGIPYEVQVIEMVDKPRRADSQKVNTKYLQLAYNYNPGIQYMI